MYTKKNTLNEILNIITELSAETIFSLSLPARLISQIPEKMRDCTLEELDREIEMPKGMPPLSEIIIDGADITDKIVKDKKYRFIPLWKDEAEGYMAQDNNNKDSVFLLTAALPIKKRRPAAIICPGGGYEMVAMNGEGYQVADRMEELGYHAFVLHYRTVPNIYPEPMKDVALAIKYIRANADMLNIDPEDILLMGFSAGGHLCAVATAFHEEISSNLSEELRREQEKLAAKYSGVSACPNKLVLSYPVISFMKEQHENSFIALTGGREELREKLSAERHISPFYPKTFVWACEDDEIVPVSNAKRMYNALTKAGVPCELKVYPEGGHGCCLAEGTSAERWIEEMHAFMKM